jgi:hypothetical protein
MADDFLLAIATPSLAAMVTASYVKSDFDLQR